MIKYTKMMTLTTRVHNLGVAVVVILYTLLIKLLPAHGHQARHQGDVYLHP